MIRVLFFASLREAVGTGECELPMPAGEHRPFGLDMLMKELESRLAAGGYAALIAENVRIAVNRELVDGPLNLNAGDEVAFLPPVTGG